jgi:ketosteroid isomerase-like protein
MSQENAEVVRRGQQARSKGNIGEWLGTLDPEIEWDISGYPMPDFPVTGKGRAEFVAHVTNYWSLWNDYSQTVEKTFDIGDDVLVLLHETARRRNSDMVIERDIATIWTIQDGVRTRFRAFQHPGEAMTAAGLTD